jgi:hypothetical protein
MLKKKRQTALKERELADKELRDKYMNEIASLGNDNPSVFSSIVKNFFKDFLKIKYEITFEELAELVTRKKLEPELIGETTNLLVELSEFEFRTDSPNFNIEHFKLSFEKVLNKITTGKEQPLVRKESEIIVKWLLKLANFFFAKRRKQPAELGELLEICRKNLFEKNLASAKEHYLLAFERYSSASEEEKERFYGSLKEIREDILNNDSQKI